MGAPGAGTAQAGLGFTHVFSRMQGQAAATSLAPAGNVLPPKPDTNPAAAPYPQWSPTAAYQTGYKVVENGEIYQAKWYNSGQDPSAQVQYSWQSPWELLGPVLPGDHAPVIRMPAGQYPAWSIHAQYRAGRTVRYQGLPYRARWANRGVPPGGQGSEPAGSPWIPLFRVPGEPQPSPGTATAPG